VLEYERGLWQRNIRLVAGIDEVGRGCLFGDVVACAVVLPAELEIEGINDSKKLSEKKRNELYDLIMEKAVGVGIGRVDARTIDEINIKQAARRAMKLALDELSRTVSPEYLLVDAEKVDCPIPQLAIIHGDALSQSIAAASIVAKVTRDRLCLHWDLEYPEYGIASHKGYATKAHREALRKYGASPMHRRSFLSGVLNEQLELF
jgi:ribonuclease HII